MAANLFEGTALPFGGVSNEEELNRCVPAEFLHGNPWTEYVSKVFFFGAYSGNWKWKSSDLAIRNRQVKIFYGTLQGFMSHEYKEALAGYMLSQMLEELPQWIDPKK